MGYCVLRRRVALAGGAREFGRVESPTGTIAGLPKPPVARPRAQRADLVPAGLAIAAALSLIPAAAVAQSADKQGADATTPLPPVTVESKPPAKKAKHAKVQKSGQGAAATAAAATPTVQPHPVDVNLDPQVLQQDGTAAQGYAAKYLSGVGPLGGRSQLDTPYNTNVVPRELIENLQVNNMTELAKVSPFLQPYVAESNGTGSGFTIRGFGTGSLGQSSGVLSLQDGIRTPSGLIQDPEDKERVEVITGVTGFLYGQNSPAGSINYVQKRPTASPYSSLTLGNYGNGLAYVHGDFGGPLDSDGKVAYRANIVAQDGNTYVDGETRERFLASLSADVRPTDNTLLEMNVAYRHSDMEGLQSSWGIFTTGGVPKAPDPTLAWGEPWTYSRSETFQSSAKFTWDITPNLRSRSGLMYIYDHLDWSNVENDIYDGGDYDQIVYASDNFVKPVLSGYQYFDLTFDTMSVKHKLTAGFSAYKQKWYVPHNWLTQDYIYLSWFGNINDGPSHIGPQPIYTESNEESLIRQKNGGLNFVIGDDIKLNEQWSVLAGVTHATIMQTTYQPLTGAAQSYDKSKVAPAATLIYKPVPWLSLYGSYLEGLDQGATAPNGTVNAGTVMPPTESTSYEAGIKAEFGKMLLTLSVFDTERGFAYTQIDPVTKVRTFVQDGIEVHKGVELSVSGKVTKDLTVFGGVTTMKPEVTDAEDANLNGARPWEVSDTMAKLYAEYALPFVPGLTLTGGINYVSKMQIYSFPYPSNDLFVPGYTTGDLGLRYETVVNGTPTTLRLNVNNFTDEYYWLTDGYLGAPRTVAFSAQAKF